MNVKTSRSVWDPYIIIKGRDMLRLLARSVPFPQAVRVLDDDVFCDIVKIGNLVVNKARFVKRRQRLLGPNGATLRALELLTNTNMHIQGSTVAVVGSTHSLSVCRKIIEDCMWNVHPVYAIKALMIKRELSKDSEVGSWERFLPKFKKTSQKKKKTTKEIKESALFPPPQLPRKEDIEMETGEFFLKRKNSELKKNL